jgi:hypothetical protein
MRISFNDLQGYVGKSMADICENGFASAHDNHCAHFVSHVLGITSGLQCGVMAAKAKDRGVSIRCDEIYNRLATRGLWDGRRALANGTLLFVTSARNVSRGVMQNVPQKHVGIVFNGSVFNFSNPRHMVISDPSTDVFHARFKGLYAGGDIALFYGVVS